MLIITRIFFHRQILVFMKSIFKRNPLGETKWWRSCYFYWSRMWW